MKTLMIKDLSTNVELDSQAMTAVTGGAWPKAAFTSRDTNAAIKDNLGNSNTTKSTNSKITWGAPMQYGFFSSYRTFR